MSTCATITAVCGLYLLLVSGIGAQTNFTGVYTENFNAMGTAGTTAPDGWTFHGALGGDNSTWTTSIPTADAGLGTLNAILIASTSTSVTSNTQGYNYAASGSTSDRGLGSSPTSGRGVTWQLSLSNTSGSALSNLGVRYDTRRFNAPTTANDLPGHWLFYSLNNGSTWSNASSLNPSITTVPNSIGTSVFVERNLSLASSWNPGTTLLLRWIDDNATQSSPDQIVGIDNVAITGAPPTSDAAVVCVDGQHVTMGSATALGSNNFTVECWFMRTGAGTTASTGTGGVVAVPLVAKGRSETDGDNRDCNYFLGINSEGKLAADFEQLNATTNGTAYAAGQNFPVIGNTVIQSGVWNHAAATYDATSAQWKLYLNGVEQSLTVPAGSPATFPGVIPRGDSIQHFAIGTAMNSSGTREGSFHGVIDEVRVWNVARGAADIANDMDAAVAHDTPGLLARYALNEGSGTTTAASPATAPNGTLAGSALWTNGFTASGNEVPEVALTAPAEAASFNLPATVNLEATASDTDGTVAKVEFFAGSTKLGEDGTEPYAFEWSGMISGNYALTARATDDLGGSTTSAPVNITIANPNNQGPSVTLTAPANGTQIPGGSTTLAATASDGDGVISKVEFYNGAVKLGEDATSPYTYLWSGVSTGTYAVSARAIDNDGASVDSIPASVTFVVPVETTVIARRPAGQPGAVWRYLDDGSNQGTAWKDPSFNDTGWASGAAPLGYGDSHINTTVNSGPTGNRIITTYLRRTFNLTGAAAVQSLRLNVLRDDGVVIHINGAEVARQNMPAGSANYLTNAASTVDSSNETTYFTSDVTSLPPLNEGSNVIAVEVHNRDASSSDLGFDLELITNSLPGTPPTIDLVTPADGATFTAPATVPITADATDNDGSVAKVEFFNGATKLGEDTAAPFAFDWTTVPQGSYTITAKATDNYGLSATSDPTSITVGPPDTAFPTVAVTSPAEGAGFLAPATVEITVDADDSDGSVAKVEFFEGSNKLGEDGTEPYAFTWSNIAAGSYSITARATDNLTAATVSTPVNITVNPNIPPSVTPLAPGNGASIGSGGLVKLSATVADPEAAPLTVTFYGRPKSPPPGEDFTLVTLPDTQFYSENSGGNRFPLFTNQTNWIVTTKNLLNTKFVAHMGDMVNTASQAQEWLNADIAMDIIENPATTLLTHGIPWGGAPGNHDGTGSEWDTHFGPSRFAGRDYYQGNYNNSNRNNYQFFSAGGMDFIVINFAYNSNTGGTQAIMDWADALLKAHPNRRAILTSHWLIGTGNPASWGGHGQVLYDNLKDNPNLFLMLCGHVHGEGRRADVFEGRTVNTVLQDYQSRINGGDSWLRYFTFKPSENRIHAYTYKTDTAPVGDPLGGTFETDADSQFTLDYNMSTPAPWTPLGTVALGGGETSAMQTWTGLNPGATYEWYAAVSDGVNAPVGGVIREFTTNGNAAPAVTLTSPANGASFTPPQTVPLTASADDIDGTIAKVEFYQGTTKIGEDETAPYGIDWSAPAGAFDLTARAIDSQGASTDSAAVAINVINPIPVVTIVATDAMAGESGADQALVFRVTRAGATTGSLAVRLAASGSAGAGDDFTGFGSPLEIPAGAQFADLALTVLADELAEGPESLGITINTDAAYEIGTPGSADAGIADSPTQQFYFANIANPAMRGPLDDADGDGCSNLLEYYFGSQPGDATSIGRMQAGASNGSVFKATFPRARNHPGVTSRVRWSPDLGSWFLSGESDGQRTVEIQESVISPPEQDPETIEATATQTNLPAAGNIFLKLEVTEE